MSLATGLRRALSAWSLALLLAGCAGTPQVDTVRPERILAFNLDGRISLRQGQQNYSGLVTWEHRGSQDEIMLSTPLGQGVAQLSGDAEQARLTLSDRHKYSAPDVDALSEQAFGARLPLKQMPAWIAGRSTGTGTLERDEQGRPRRLVESGWTVTYLSFEGPDAHALPTLLHLERDDIELRLKIDSWGDVE